MPKGGGQQCTQRMNEETLAQHRHSWDKMRQMGMNKIEDTEEMERDDAMKAYDILRMNDDIL